MEEIGIVFIFPPPNIRPCPIVYIYRNSPSKAIRNPVYLLEDRGSQRIPDNAQLNSADYAEVNEETVRLYMYILVIRRSIGGKVLKVVPLSIEHFAKRG
jgi:hypothetical protein